MIVNFSFPDRYFAYPRFTHWQDFDGWTVYQAGLLWFSVNIFLDREKQVTASNK